MLLLHKAFTLSVTHMSLLAGLEQESLYFNNDPKQMRRTEIQRKAPSLRASHLRRSDDIKEKSSKAKNFKKLRPLHANQN